MACVYLIHFALPGGGDVRPRQHWLGVAPGRGDPVLPETVTHGRGAVAVPPGAAIVDVWECQTAAEAKRLYAALRRQGGRARLCSVCSPGNGRGGGRGHYPRAKKADPGR